MYYGKFENGVFIFAPKKIRIGDALVFNPTDEQLESEGFKPMVYSEPSEAPEGFQYEDSWEEQEDKIVQVWGLVEVPVSHDADYAEAGKILMGVEE